jgi:hypothetical protein
VAGPLCVRGQSLDLLRARRADDVELDDHLLEVGGSVIYVVLLRVAERRADVSAGVVDRDPVQRREPRQLGEQSKGRGHHHELERRGALLGAAPTQRLI